MNPSEEFNTEALRRGVRKNYETGRLSSATPSAFFLRFTGPEGNPLLVRADAVILVQAFDTTYADNYSKLCRTEIRYIAVNAVDAVYVRESIDDVIAAFAALS